MRRIVVLLLTTALLIPAVSVSAADPYVNHCDRTTKLSDCFDIMLMNASTGQQWWTAPYARTLTYTDNTGWVDGDRSGYRCAFMFLKRGNKLVGRATFVRSALYGKVNDSGMKEGVRGYDGRGYLSQADCPDPDIAYKPNAAPGQTPTIRFMAGTRTLEVRSYPHTQVNGKFIQVEKINLPFIDKGDHPNSRAHFVYSRVTVVFYSQINGVWQPGIVVYYDSLVSGVRITSDLG